MTELHLKINNTVHRVYSSGETPLLYVLRNELNLVSPRYGCAQEQCGACKVIVDGQLEYTCTYTLDQAQGKSVTTLEGLQSGATLHQIQTAFIEENAAQCGYCSTGVINAAKLLLEQNPDPTRDDIQQALKDHLCRCGAHNRMIKAVQGAARRVRL